MTDRYDYGRTGFEFRCPGCDTMAPAGFARIQKRPQLECGQCEQVFDVPDAERLTTLAGAAATALYALREQLDRGQLYSRVHLLGVHFDKVGRRLP